MLNPIGKMTAARQNKMTENKLVGLMKEKNLEEMRILFIFISYIILLYRYIRFLKLLLKSTYLQQILATWHAS